MFVDTDKMENDLMPLIKTVIVQFNEASAQVKATKLPQDEYDWSYNSKKFCEGAEYLNKYSTYINDVHSRLNVGIKTNVEEIEALEVDEIKKKDILVK